MPNIPKITIQLGGDAYSGADDDEKRAELYRRAIARQSRGKGGKRTQARISYGASRAGALMGGGKASGTAQKSPSGTLKRDSRKSPPMRAVRKTKRQRSGYGRRTSGGYLEG